jgi:hypothetical protein
LERRACERIPVNIDVKFYCCNRVYVGTVANLSEKGMFINITDMSFPLDIQFEIMIPDKGKTLRVPVNLNRIEMSPTSRDGIGVELLNPPEEYLKFIKSLKSFRSS